MLAKIKLRADIMKKNTEANDSLASLHPVLKTVYQNRGISHSDELEYKLKNLLPYHQLKNIDLAAKRLVEAIVKQQKIVIVGDYDADGATSSALAMQALSVFGAGEVNFFLPDRVKHGYGLSPMIVHEVKQKFNPQLLITVDNGISSIAGVAAAREVDIEVLITDHHLAAAQVPEDCIIVNPNQKDDKFPSKNLAGVGVIFYVMLSLRAELKRIDYFTQQNIAEPNMGQFLDLVALGTVADVVPLDYNNRILVKQGIARIRQGKGRPGINSLIKIGKREADKLVSEDLGFCVGPRLNAAGRLDDMTTGVRCLLASDNQTAASLATELDSLNHQRRHLEQDMQQQAQAAIEKYQYNDNMPVAISLYNKDWHEGIIGLIASRIKERLYRPTIIFTKSKDGSLKGSGRSIKGLHLRDALADINAASPGLINKFGGHAMAAGLSINADAFDKFTSQFQSQVQKQIDPLDLEACIYSDGQLSDNELTLPIAELLQEAGPWGQAFPAPIFHGKFTLLEQRIVGQNHLKMTLGQAGSTAHYAAIAFQVDLDTWPNYNCQEVEIVYRLDINSFRNRRSLQLIVEQLVPAGDNTNPCEKDPLSATIAD